MEFEGNDPDELQVQLDNAADGVVNVDTPDATQNTTTPTINDGSFTIGSGDAFALSNEASFTNDASVANSGSLTLDASTWTQSVTASGARTSGNAIVLTDSTLDDSAGPGQFQLVGSCYLYGTIPAGQTVTVDGTSTDSFAVISDNVINDGTLILDSGGGDAYADLQAYVDPPTFTNNGTLESELPPANGGSNYLEVDLDNTTTGRIEVLSGTLSQDDGTTTTNDGILAVDATASAAAAFDLTNESAFTNDSDGTLAFDIASASSFGALSLSSGTTFTLAGAADPILIGGYAPPVGTEFDVISGAGSGAFTAVDNNFSADYNSANSVGLVRDPDSTATTVSASPPATAYGSTVTLKATISTGPGGVGNPTGTVSFHDAGNVLLGTATPSTTAGVTTATLNVSTLAVETHSITATYGGSDNYSSSASATPAPVTVSPAGTTTTLKSSANPATFGQLVTLTATVAGPAGATAPTGAVTFTDGSTTLGTGTLTTTAGVTTATLNVSTLAVATHSITASYTGNADYNASTTTTALSQVINKAIPTTTVSSSSGTVTYGQTVTFKALVSGPVGAAAPTGTVTFKDGSTQLGPVTLTTVNGVTSVSLSTSTLAGGLHSITATYTGNTDYTSAASTTPAPVTVNPANTTTTLKSSLNPATFGQPITLTATVAGPAGAPAPTGSVTFVDGSATLGTGTLTTTAGVTSATLNVSALAARSHPITASYAGSADYSASSTSSTLTQVIKQATPSAAVTLSSSSITSGQPVTFTATVAGPAGASAPTGTVTLTDGTTTLGTGTLSMTDTGAATATLTVPTLAAGPHSITASYSGDPNYRSATATPLNEVVNPPTSISPNQSTSSTTTAVGTPTAVSTSASTTTTASAVTTTSSTTTSTTTTVAPPPPPVLYKAENVAPVSGKVYIALPPGATLSRAATAGGPLAGESLSKGTHFIPLTQARQIPVGSVLDTLGGTVAVTAASTKRGQYYTGNFTAGIFELLQERGQQGLSDITLMDTLNRNKACASVGKKASVARNVSSKVLGLLKSTDHGRFSTRGDYSAATVRGTQYSVEDTCAGTITTVTRGSVVVDYFRRHRNVVVSAGQAFLAKASGAPSTVVSIGKKPAKKG